MFLKFEVFNRLLDYSFDLSSSYSLNTSKELEGLYYSKLGEDSIILRTIAYELTNISELFLYIEALDRDLTSCRQYISC